MVDPTFVGPVFETEDLSNAKGTERLLKHARSRGFFSDQQKRVIKICSEQLLWDSAANMDSMPGSMVELSRSILATWYGGNGKGSCNTDMKEVGLWQSRYSDGKWSKPVCIHLDKKQRAWNPVFMKTDRDQLTLFFRSGNVIQEATSQMMRSQDDGATYSQRENLPEGIRGASKASPVVLDDGTWIVPSSASSSQEPKSTAAWLETTRDGGKQWKKYGPIIDPQEPFGLTEPCLIHDSQDRLQVFCRNRANKIGKIGYIWKAIFSLSDMTIKEIKKTDLANPDSGIDGVRLYDGTMALVHNDSFTQRFPLVFSLSHDDGETFSKLAVLEKGPGEFSQPCFIQSRDEKLHILYAYRPEKNDRKNLKHVVLQLKKYA